MKISLPFSSSSSTSSTPTLNVNLCSSPSANTAAGCISGIIRRFFRGESLRTHPFEDHRKELQPEVKVEPLGTPGVVARLMGLETMPEKGRERSLISRSRSMNSVDPTERQQRRVKSSLSFRDVPMFLQLENDEFLLLTFENEELGLKWRRSEMGSLELKQRRGDRGAKNVERNHTNTKKERRHSKRRLKVSDCDEIEYLSSIPSHTEEDYRKTCSPPRHKTPVNLASINEVPSKAKSAKKKRRNKKKSRSTGLKGETQCSSESSSPVSVLDLCDFLIEPRRPSSEGLRESHSTSRRKLSTDNVVIPENPSLPLKSVSGNCMEPTKVDSHTGDYFDLWGEVCRLVEEDMGTSKWIPKEMWKMGDFEDMGIDVALQIVEGLVNEVVVELAQVLI
ncbi:hypothetical protein GIB67_027531 [Kingdonia uniflora]|uniref:DUF3741 domain-containing protein n=1 Tax=Kingdonia uniflora TaxID=39325 RepID=A0A7J7MFY5_9MAGN|nr:hypothetical protein GIB67_027531 [Kingdonia uniflora]